MLVVTFAPSYASQAIASSSAPSFLIPIVQTAGLPPEPGAKADLDLFLFS